MKYLYLTKNNVAEVDDDVYTWASQNNWWCTGEGYVVREGLVSDKERKGKTIYLHAEIMNKDGHILKPGEVFDHIDRDLLNNKRSNLRQCTKQQNCCNSPSRKGSSIYKGVTFHSNKWQARIRVFNKCISLGHFRLEKDAAKAYDKAAIKYFGDFAYTNLLKEN